MTVRDRRDNNSVKNSDEVGINPIPDGNGQIRATR